MIVKTDYKKITDLNYSEAKAFFLKGSSYFNSDFPEYISFDNLLNKIYLFMDGKDYQAYKNGNPENEINVNYELVSNKDGRFSWRALQLIHPVIYISLLNAIFTDQNWKTIISVMGNYPEKREIIECASIPVINDASKSDKAAQVGGWWQEFEQKSLFYSLKYSHIINTDVSDCYGSIYTHSISWAIHGKDLAKNERGNKNLIGNIIDRHIRACSNGQTNGIPQGSVLMDFIAEIVLNYVDMMIYEDLCNRNLGIKILRYRDDYRIFSNSDASAELVLKLVSDKLRGVGMRLGVAKTHTSTNVIEGSIKPDKIAALDLSDLGSSNAKTIQKQLLRLHAFGQRYPNSGALRRLLSIFYRKIYRKIIKYENINTITAIMVDILLISPATIPVVAAILSNFLSYIEKGGKDELWQLISSKLKTLPYNGYLEIWMQRIAVPKDVAINFNSEEAICKIVKGDNDVILWNNDWISSSKLKSELNINSIVIKDPSLTAVKISPSEIDLFQQKTDVY